MREVESRWMAGSWPLFTSESITSFSGLPFPPDWTPLSPAAAADGAVKHQEEGICQYGTWAFEVSQAGIRAGKNDFVAPERVFSMGVYNREREREQWKD